ncbi:unnamed protein product [Amaranthus hypochondriacus]
MSTSKLIALGLLESVVALAFLCAKYTRKASQKLVRIKPGAGCNTLILGNKHATHKDLGEQSFGDAGLWRRSILMGDKCEPLNFSGVIYYDCNGNKLSEPPIKSPRSTPFVGYDYPIIDNY